MCKLYVRLVWIFKKIEYLEWCSKGSCVHYIYGLSGFAETLEIQNCINSTGNFVHYMYWFPRFAEKLNIQNFLNSTGNCLHYMYEMSGFAEKLEIKIV